LQEGIGEKIGMFIFFMTIFLASIINAFIHGWELTLVILAAMPVRESLNDVTHFFI
jgi:ATP-binding cassette subfamily B (MDR/TAP) protein 1